MALQLKSKQSSKWKALGVPSAVVLGSAYIVLRTFPHLKVSLYDYITGNRREEQDNFDNSPIQLNDNESHDGSNDSDDINDNANDNDIINESMVDVNQWSNDNLKSWLQEVRI